MIDITKIELDRAMTVTIIFIAAVIPPLWFIYNFAPSIFFGTDTIKLILLCASIGFGTILLNSFFQLALWAFDNTRDDKEFATAKGALILIFTGSLFNFPVFFFPGMATFFFDVHVDSANDAVISLAYVYAGCVVLPVVLKSLRWFLKKAWKYITSFFPEKKK